MSFSSSSASQKTTNTSNAARYLREATDSSRNGSLPTKASFNSLTDKQQSTQQRMKASDRPSMKPESATLPVQSPSVSSKPAHEQMQARTPSGMQSILNPTSEASDLKRPQPAQEKADPSGVVLPSLAYIAQGMTDLPRSMPSANAEAPPRALLPNRSNSRTFTGRLSIPMSPMDMRDTEMSAPRHDSTSTYRRTQTVGLAPISAPPSAVEPSSYPFPSPSLSTPPLQHRRVSAETSRSFKSRSSSPMSQSYGSMSQASTTAPSSMPAMASPYGHAQFGNSRSGLATSIQFNPDRKFESGPGSSYHMTLDTEQGPIRIPVDMQAASKMADEKRRRNAGASARFRQRRKEKEREASQTISRLEKEMRGIAEEREFYRGERNFFRDMLARAAGPSQVPHRPPSPRLTRPQHDIDSDTPSWDSHAEADVTRNTRRKIGEHRPDPTTAPSIFQMPQYQGPPPPPPPSMGAASHEARSIGGASIAPAHSSGPLPPPSMMQIQPDGPPARPYEQHWQPRPQ